jgi:putative ABC transport system ATP-binding protein
MIELDNIIKSFPFSGCEMKILKGIELFIARGEFVSIMGPSGSGKTTLAAILGCLSSPTSGTYKLDGAEVSSMNTHELSRYRRDKIGFIFQDFNLLEGMTALENVSMPLVYSGVSSSKRKQRAKDCLAKVGLAERMHHTPKQLSGGQKQRVAIARALVNNPTLLFADEPTGALDQKTTTEVMELLRSLNVSGHTIVQVTHSQNDANYSKRVVTITDGLIVQDKLVEGFTTGNTDNIEENPRDRVILGLWQVGKQIKATDDSVVAAFDAMIPHTNSQSGLIEAAKSLVKIPGVAYEKHLKYLAKHENWAVRSEIIKNLPFEKPFAVDMVMSAMKDESSWVRFSAIMRAVQKPGSFKSKMDGVELVNMLNDSDERVRAAIVSLLAEFGAESFEASIIECLRHDPNARVRANCVEALKPLIGRNAGNNDAVSAISECFDVSNHRLRSTAAVYLYDYKSEESYNVLATMIEDENILTRAAGCWGLGQLTTEKRAANRLLEMILSETEEMVRSNIIRSLVKMADDLGKPFADQVSYYIEVQPELVKGPVA